jgi:hypothetical protein
METTTTTTTATATISTTAPLAGGKSAREIAAGYIDLSSTGDCAFNVFALTGHMVGDLFTRVTELLGEDEARMALGEHKTKVLGVRKRVDVRARADELRQLRDVLATRVAAGVPVYPNPEYRFTNDDFDRLHNWNSAWLAVVPQAK